MQGCRQNQNADEYSGTRMCDCWLVVVVNKFEVEAAIMESATNESYLTVLLRRHNGSPRVNVLASAKFSLRGMFDTK